MNIIYNLKRALKIVYKSSGIITVVLLIVTILYGLIVPATLYANKNLIDSVAISLKDGNLKRCLFWIFILASCYILNNLFEQTTSYLQEFQTKYIGRYLDELILNKLKNIDLVNFDDSVIYNHIEQINQNSLSNIESILSTITNILKIIVSIISVALIIFKFNPYVLLICVCSTVPMVIVNLKILIKEYDIYINRLEKLRFIDYLKNLFYKYDSLKEIKIFNIGNYIIDLILKTNDKHIKEDKTYKRKFITAISITNFFEIVFSLGNMFYIIYHSIKMRISIGSFSMYISAINNMENLIREFLDGVMFLYNNNLYISSLFLVLDLDENEESLETSISNSKKFKRIEKFNIKNEFESIEFRNVYFKYKNSNDYILKDINLKFEKNKSYSLVGLNGSGKTTLIKLLTGLYKPSKGKIFINNKDVNDYNKNELKNLIGVIFQDFNKYPLSISDNIGLGNLNHIDDEDYIKLSSSKSGAHNFIKDLEEDYQTKLLREWTDGVDLSGGQWQKIALSRAFMSSAPMIILDEPTSSMDAKSEFEIFKIFKKIMKDKTSILISHKFSTVKLSEQIYVLDQGTIIEKGNHQELMNRDGLYKELYLIQSNNYKSLDA
ncbi:ABC transporter ATP-binding protein [Peptostreptococcaceae bacterium AGR-M142]